MTSPPLHSDWPDARATEFLLVQGELVDLIAAGGPLVDTLPRIATAIERVIPTARCSILLLDADGHRLRHGAAPSLPEDFNQAIDGLFIGPGAGSCGTAVYRRKPVLARDISTDPLWAEVRSLALLSGLRACWSQPIIDDGGAALGAVALYYTNCRQLEETDGRIVEAMTRLLRLALVQHRKEAALRESEWRYRLLAEHASDVIIRMVIDGDRLYVSPSVTGMLGYEPEELVGGATLSLVHPDDAEDTQAILRNLVPNGPPATTIHRIRRKDGGYIWAEFVARQVTAAAGRQEIIGVIRDITTRRTAAEKLRESEEQYRVLAENASDVIIRTVLNGPRLYVSPSVRQLLGYDPADLLPGTGFDVVHPDHVERVRSIVESLTPDSASALVEYPARRKDGSFIWVEARMQLVAGAEGRPEVIGALRNIAARRAAEERLHEAKQRAEAAEQRAKQAQLRLEEAIEALSEGLALFDADDRLVLCNAQYRALYPKSRGAITPGARFLEILREGVRCGEYEAATDRPDEWIAERLALHARPSAMFEQQLTDGRWLRVQEHRLADGGSIGVRIDITDLKDREASFKLLFDGNPVPMWVFDRETLRFLEVNQAALEHYGYSRAQFLAMTIIDIRPPEDVERLRGTMQNEGALRNFHRTWRHRRADGSLIDVDVLGHLLEFQGRPAQLTAAFDVTKRNNIAAALRLAKEGAEAANRTKSQFLAAMSHELRTPLNAILGFSELIRDARMGPVDPQCREYAHDIHASGQHLLSLINDILDLSKVEVGRLELHEERLDVREIVKSSCRVVAERAHAAGLGLEVRIGEDLPPVLADRLRLKQVLINLMSNAVKFTPSGGRVSVSAAAPAGGGIDIEVTDTGIGMRPEDIPIALEPFRQIDSAQNRHYEGTGLGLPLSKRLVELHGGALELESKPGRGTTVRVWLPERRVLRESVGPMAATGDG